MKRLILMAAIASAALASCVKNEVIIDTPPQEIGYQTIINPATKADTYVEFAKTYKFHSWAYLFTDYAEWPASADASNQGSLYIGKSDSEGALISYKDANQYWKAEGATYYWPKDPKFSLTFFAWADGTTSENGPTVSLNSGQSISCAKNTGIKVTEYDVTLNQNKDFMVADVQDNKKSNESMTVGTTVTEGVKTIFRHQLSKVDFKVNLSQSYDGLTFNLTGISFLNVNTKSPYQQLNITNGSLEANYKVWSNPTEPETLEVFSGTSANLSTNDMDVTATGYQYFLPQQFTVTGTPQKLQISYTIKHTTPDVTENVTHTIDLYNSDSSNALFGVNEWEPGKNYVLTITIGLNEIKWAPAIVDWVPDTNDTVSI